MNLLVASSIWQKMAQNGPWLGFAFSERLFLCTLKTIANVSSKASVSTSHYRYPSPSRRFGSNWVGPLFFDQRDDVQQRTAENRGENFKDSIAQGSLLLLASIKTLIRGTNQCRSNTWRLLPSLLHRFPDVWTMTLNAQPQARSQAQSSWKSRAADCLPARLLGPGRAHFATMSAFATELKLNVWTHRRSRTTTENAITTGPALGWLFCDRGMAATMGPTFAQMRTQTLTQNFTMNNELARAVKWRAGSEQMGAVMARTILGKAC